MVIWMRWHCPPDTWFEIEPCWSAAKYVISRSCRLPTIFNLYDWAERKHFVLWNLECQNRRRICDLWLSKQAPGPRPLVLLLHTMADQEGARGGGVSHTLAEKRLLASLHFDVLCILADIYRLISKTVPIIDLYDIDDVLYWFKYIYIYFFICVVKTHLVAQKQLTM